MSKMPNTNSDQRSFIRLKIDTIISFTVVGGSGERYQGRCRNISGAGLLFETDKKVKIGDNLEIIVPSENKTVGNLCTSVEVIRCSSLSDQHKYSVGVRIKQVLS